MVKNIKKLIHPIIFTVCGMTVGFLYYKFIGCYNGSCAITSSPIKTMIYVGIMGLLLSFVFEKKK